MLGIPRFLVIVNRLECSKGSVPGYAWLANGLAGEITARAREVGDDALVFSTRTGGRIRQDMLSREIAKAARELGRTFTNSRADGTEGNETRKSYDALGCTTSITDAFGTPDAATVILGYMPTGRLVETTAAEDVDNDGLKEKSIVLYDGFGRPVLARSSIGVESKTGLDPVGQPVLSETHAGGITPVAGDTSQNVLLASSEVLYDVRAETCSFCHRLAMQGVPSLPEWLSPDRGHSGWSPRSKKEWSDQGESNSRLEHGKLVYCHYTMIAGAT